MGKWVAIFIFLILPGWLPLSGQAQPSAECGGPWIARGQRTVTPAQVIGASSERLPLYANHPAPDPDARRKEAADGRYLIAGDKIDLVTACKGYAYVRFHGARRVWTGWVEEARVQKMGNPYVPLPPNAPRLCKAAGNENHGTGSLKPLPLSPLSADALHRLHLEPDPNASPPQAAYVTVQGRSLALVSIDAGGTCHTSSILAVTGDLKARLSPDDMDDRNPFNTGKDGWDFGVNESLVEVLGQPMVLSADLDRHGDGRFYLSLIDKNADMVPTCFGKRVDTSPQIRSSRDDRTCHAILSSDQTAIPMHAPMAGEKLALSKHTGNLLNDPDIKQTATTLSYPGDLASIATYRLQSSGLVDIDNNGHPRRVSIVTLVDENSSSGCGDYSRHYAKPVYLDDHGLADPDAALNKRFDGLGEGMSEASFAKLAGRTYLKLSPAGPTPGEIWYFDAHGAHRICEFQLQRYEVAPLLK